MTLHQFEVRLSLSKHPDSGASRRQADGDFRLTIGLTARRSLHYCVGDTLSPVT